MFTANKKVRKSPVVQHQQPSVVCLDDKNKCKAITVSWLYQKFMIEDAEFSLVVEMTFTTEPYVTIKLGF